MYYGITDYDSAFNTFLNFLDFGAGPDGIRQDGVIASASDSVDEDSVTGSAHAVLTPFWAKQLGRDSFTAYQASARGGHVNCRLDGETAWLGGNCVTVVEGLFRI